MSDQTNTHGNGKSLKRETAASAVVVEARELWQVIFDGIAQARRERMADHPDVLTPGSFVIERYTYDRPRGGKGVQWLVHRVGALGYLDNLIALDTRREAAKFIEDYRG